MRWVYGPLDWPEAIEDPGKHDFLEARPLKEVNTGSYQATDTLQNTCQMWGGDRILHLAGSTQPSSVKVSEGVTMKSLTLMLSSRNLDQENPSSTE